MYGSLRILTLGNRAMAGIIVCLPTGDSPIAAASDNGLPAICGTAGRELSEKINGEYRALQ